jgi:hypothetical protein
MRQNISERNCFIAKSSGGHRPRPKMTLLIGSIVVSLKVWRRIHSRNATDQAATRHAGLAASRRSNSPGAAWASTESSREHRRHDAPPRSSDRKGGPSLQNRQMSCKRWCLECESTPQFWIQRLIIDLSAFSPCRAGVLARSSRAKRSSGVLRRRLLLRGYAASR